MKLKKVIFSLSLLIFGCSFALVGCGKQPMTQEECFGEWVKARDFALACNDNYTVQIQNETYMNNTLSMNYVMKESKLGEDYFFIHEDYSLNEEQTLEITETTTKTTKKIADGETQRTVFYQSLNNEGNISESAQYVASNYADTVAYQMPSEQFDGTYVEDGDTYEEFLASVKQSYLEDCGIEPEITFVQNSDNSITLKITVSGEVVDSDIKNIDDDYVNSLITLTFEITAKNGKIVKLSYETVSVNIFGEVLKNYTSKIVASCSVSYEFDTVTFDSITVNPSIIEQE